jgi:hypothetical protein
LFLICFFFPFSLFPFNALSHKRGGGETSCPDASRVP